MEGRIDCFWYTTFGFQTFTTSEDVDSLNAQTYVLEVTDNNGCIYTDTFNLGVYELYVQLHIN